MVAADPNGSMEDDPWCDCCRLHWALPCYCSMLCRHHSARRSLGMSRRNRTMSCMRSAAAPSSADTDSPACSTIAPRDTAYCRASLSSARSISVSPAADASSETQGGGVASKARDASCGRNPSPMKAEDVITAKGRPFTGAEYLASLRDGRDVYIYGERV